MKRSDELAENSEGKKTAHLAQARLEQNFLQSEWNRHKDLIGEHPIQQDQQERVSEVERALHAVEGEIQRGRIWEDSIQGCLLLGISPTPVKRNEK